MSSAMTDPAIPLPAPAAPAPVGTRPWGPWLTLVLGGAIFIIYSFAQGLGLVPSIVFYASHGVPPNRLHEIAMTGLSLSLATAIGCPVMLFVCALLASARRGPPLQDYFALHLVRFPVLVRWSITLIVVAIGFSIVNDLLHREPPEFIVHAYSTAGYAPLLWAAVGICAPVAEEFLFRGFLFAGLAASRLGSTGAVIITSFFFAIIHAGQYGWVDLSQIGVVGILLGLARARTGSLLPPVAMHIALNLTSLTLYALTESAEALQAP